MHFLHIAFFIDLSIFKDISYVTRNNGLIDIK